MLEKFSLGTGDRFGQQGKAQLKAIQKAKREHHTIITPVWNKSHREHEIIGTGPKDVRKEADLATEALDWKEPYCVDADHITKEIVDPYIKPSNFFTIDVAESIGEKSETADKETFIKKNEALIGQLEIPIIDEKFEVTKHFLEEWADQYLLAIQQAKVIYDYINDRKSDDVVYEISMDEVEAPQSPLELYFILKTIAEAGINIHTIAPKFTGDFYKGVDYVGDIDQFVKEFEQDLLVIAHVADEFSLSPSLKLSVHSGSDKFSLYPYIHNLLLEHDAGVHLKTSGTTWLEELIGLAGTEKDGLALVHKIYKEAYGRYGELTRPYKPVININKEHLPSPEEFSGWSANTIVEKIEHNRDNSNFDSQLRQFLHCSYKIAAEQGNKFIQLLQDNEDEIGGRVTNNLYERHICPLFLGK